MQETSFLTEEWFWAAVAAVAGSAAIIGAFFSWLTSAIIKRREQPEADWAVTMDGYAIDASDHGQDPGFHLQGRISNVGDGSAFHVRLETRNCTARLSPKETQGMAAMPFMPSGSVLTFGIEMDLDQWDEADVDIVWTVPPTRLKKKMRSSLTPKEFMEMPGVNTLDPKTGAVYKRPVKSLHQKPAM